MLRSSQIWTILRCSSEFTYRNIMIRRRKLGNTYTKSPAQQSKAWFTVNLGKIFFTFFMTIGYLILLYIGVGIVGFIGRDVANKWTAEDFVTADVYNGPVVLIIKVVGIIFIIMYVFRDAKGIKK